MLLFLNSMCVNTSFAQWAVQQIQLKSASQQTNTKLRMLYITGIWPYRCNYRAQTTAWSMNVLAPCTQLYINNHRKVICSAHCIFVWNYNRSGTSFNYLQTYVGTGAEGCYLASWVCACLRVHLHVWYFFSSVSVCIVFLCTDFSALPFGLCEFRLLCLHYCSGPWDSLEDSACL